MTTPTATTATEASWTEPDSRRTPPPVCRYPVFDVVQTACDDLYATSWGGCPSGYTSACGTSTFYAGRNTRSSLSGAASLNTFYEQILCCPDQWEWECSSMGTYLTSCATMVATDLSFAFPAGMGASTKVHSIAAGRTIKAHGVIVSSATATQPFSYTSYVGAELSPTEIRVTATYAAWCDLPSCADVDFSPTVPPAVVTERLMVPPPNMGKLGDLGIFAISGLIGAIVLAAAVLLPSVWEYRRRMEQRLRVE